MPATLPEEHFCSSLPTYGPNQNDGDADSHGHGPAATAEAVTVTDWRTARTVEHRGSSLGLAVRLVDVFTGERPAADLSVSLAESDAAPVFNPSGYHVFLQLPAGSVTLVVDGDERYFDERRRIHLSGEPTDAAADADGAPPSVALDDRTTPVVVELTPTPAYEFPDSTTTVRGHVEDADGAPIKGATVSLPEFDVATQTTETGEYALFVPVNSADVVRRDGRKFVRVDDGDAARADGRGVANGGTGHDPTIAVTHPSYPGREERIAVEAGTRTVHYVTLTG